MKKFASLFICLLLVASMAICGAVSVSAYTATDKTASIEIIKQTPDKEKIGGAEFSIYKIIEMDSNGYYHVTAAFEDAGLSLDSLVSSEGGNLSYGDTAALEAKINDLVSFINTNSVRETAKGTTATDGTDKGKYTFTNQKYGVYLVIETGVPAGYVASSKPFLVALNADSVKDGKVTAEPKNEKVTVDKKVNGTHQASYSVGDIIPYEITSTIPTYDEDVLDAYHTKYDGDEAKAELPYYFIDTFSAGLTYLYESDVKDGITVKVNNTTLDADNYKVSYDPSSRKLRIDFKWSALEASMGKSIVISYKAQLNENAVLTTTGNKNEVELHYANDPKTYDPGLDYDPDTNPDPEDPEDPPITPGEDPVVYTYGMDLTKYFDNKTATQSGANATKVKFTLSKDGNAIKFYLESGVYHVWTGDAEDLSGKTLVDELVANSDGKISVKGLGAGTYTLTETNTDTGYTKIAPVTIIVEDNKGTDTKLTGKVDAYNTSKENKLSNSTDGTSFVISVNNAKSQFTLPQTGGLGLWMFTLAGGLGLAGAIIVLVVIRRKKASK